MRMAIHTDRRMHRVEPIRTIVLDKNRTGLVSAENRIPGIFLPVK